MRLLDYNFTLVKCGKTAVSLILPNQPVFFHVFQVPTKVTLGDPYWTSRENSLELIELSSINKISSV
jgi:hypothetical protein